VHVCPQILETRLKFRFNCGSGELTVSLTYANASDGQWHVVSVERVGQWVTLKMDGGEGRWFNESTGGVVGGRTLIRISQRSVFAGGDVRFPSSISPPLVDNDFENGRYFFYINF